jgi:predicted phosphoadenosine phosphosulfate sulfurtransferase
MSEATTRKAQRERHFTDVDVYTATRQRAIEIFSLFDDICIGFSGGKDSLVTLEFMDMIRKELNISKLLNVIFYDEELLTDEHIDFVKSVRDSGRFNFIWVVAPLKSQKYILGKSFPYTQWDISREWVRQYPEYAEVYLDCKPLDQSEVYNTYIVQRFTNSVLCLGLRAQESLNRLRAVLSTTQLEKPYLYQQNSYYHARIIYDWSERDIFKFIHDKKLRFTEVYNQQTWSGAKYRVATPLVSEGVKHLDKLKVQDPKFYDRLMQVFPEMLVQERYWHDLDTNNIYETYGYTQEGIIKYIEDTISGANKRKALRQVEICFNHRQKETIEPDRGISMYPVQYIFECVVKGSYKKYITMLPTQSITQKMRDNEPSN